MFLPQGNNPFLSVIPKTEGEIECFLLVQQIPGGRIQPGRPALGQGRMQGNCSTFPSLTLTWPAAFPFLPSISHRLPQRHTNLGPQASPFSRKLSPQLESLPANYTQRYTHPCPDVVSFFLPCFLELLTAKTDPALGGCLRLWVTPSR